MNSLKSSLIYDDNLLAYLSNLLLRDWSSNFKIKRVTDDLLLSLVDELLCVRLVEVYCLVGSIGLLSFRAEMLVGSGPLWQRFKWWFLWLCVIWWSDWLAYWFVYHLSNGNIVLERVLDIILRSCISLLSHRHTLPLCHIRLQLSLQKLILKPQLIGLLLIILWILIPFLITNIHRHLLFLSYLKNSKLIN